MENKEAKLAAKAAAAEEVVELNNEQLDEIDGGKTVWITKTVSRKKTNFWGKTKKKTRTFMIPIEIDD